MITARQRLLRWTYPFWMKLAGRFQKNKKIIQPPQRTDAPADFYRLTAQLTNAQPFSFASLRGKKVLIVNTASDCGYTGQYVELEKLWQTCKDQLTILAFPSNDFKEQEQANDADIARFCSINYGVSFPLFSKIPVLEKNNPNPVYHWLTHPEANGWNSHYPDWNFAKYLVDEEGRLLAYFGPAISPCDEQLLQLVKG